MFESLLITRQCSIISTPHVRYGVDRRPCKATCIVRCVNTAEVFTAVTYDAQLAERFNTFALDTVFTLKGVWHTKQVISWSGLKARAQFIVKIMEVSDV